MTQEQLDNLIEDGIELQIYDDQYETASFLQNLANKYNLIFDIKDYIILDSVFVRNTDIKQYGKHIDSENTYPELWNPNEEELMKGLTNE